MKLEIPYFVHYDNFCRELSIFITLFDKFLLKEKREGEGKGEGKRLFKSSPQNRQTDR